MAGKPGDETTPTSPDEPGTVPGQLGKDDRGNVTWEWADTAELRADDEIGDMERVRALVDPKLVIVDDDDAPDDPLAVNPQRLRTGYNPYNSGALGKQSWKKKKNLQELSKWIELRRKLAERQDDEQ